MGNRWCAVRGWILVIVVVYCQKEKIAQKAALSQQDCNTRNNEIWACYLITVSLLHSKCFFLTNNHASMILSHQILFISLALFLFLSVSGFDYLWIWNDISVSKRKEKCPIFWSISDFNCGKANGDSYSPINPFKLNYFIGLHYSVSKIKSVRLT